MNYRALALVGHRWVGLATSAMVAMMGLTGAVLVWPGESTLSRLANTLHDSFGLGRVGWLLALACTAAAVLLQITGLWLWLRTRRLRVRVSGGPRQLMGNLHHVAGAVGFPLMLLIAATGIARPVVRATVPEADRDRVHAIVTDLHTGATLPAPVLVLYAAASAGFMLQGVTGVVMWWPKRPSDLAARIPRKSSRVRADYRAR